MIFFKKCIDAIRIVKFLMIIKGEILLEDFTLLTNAFRDKKDKRF